MIGQQQGANWSYFGYDGLGSVRQITNSTGVIGYSANYDPYGNPLEQFGTLPTKLGFTGEYTDPSGLLYLRARYANLSTGTFLTRDPFAGVMQRAMSRNGYSYVEGNPVNDAVGELQSSPADSLSSAMVHSPTVLRDAGAIAIFTPSSPDPFSPEFRGEGESPLAATCTSNPYSINQRIKSVGD